MRENCVMGKIFSEWAFRSKGGWLTYSLLLNAGSLWASHCRERSVLRPVTGRYVRQNLFLDKMHATVVSRRTAYARKKNNFTAGPQFFMEEDCEVTPCTMLRMLLYMYPGRVTLGRGMGLLASTARLVIARCISGHWCFGHPIERLTRRDVANHRMPLENFCKFGETAPVAVGVYSEG